MIPSKYFKEYREKLGFPNQSSAKEFLSGKDISPEIDFKYIDSLNERIAEIVKIINTTIHQSAQRKDIASFSEQHIISPYKIILAAGLLQRLNNQGRRPEEVLFSWLRGYAITEFFTPSIAKIFAVPITTVSPIGEDDLKKIETFKKSPKADLELAPNGKKLRIEIQSGFQGINDIKEHKVREARKVREQNDIPTICIHFDLFNGQVAFIRLDAIKDNDIHWVTRQQMEGQSVFAIDQNYFRWQLLDPIPSFTETELAQP